ncbi:hypothetical protein CLV56_1532 [Mumia flava]|uniref:Uncharacterized protein n=1 Tax=Mumia flava TaxID=1348852 RepID=A0A0B2BT12_9ACTN|nr:hypothetical protein [Mumia flava]PJJ57305.1 hypothetical protein CLV56_1532 [Mumia flava]
MAEPQRIEVRVDGGLAGTQTVEVTVSRDASDAFVASLSEAEIAADPLDKRPPDLDGVVLAVGSFHLGRDGSGFGTALRGFTDSVAPAAVALSIDGTSYDVADQAQVGDALADLRARQESDDDDALEARASWQREYEQEQGSEDSEEPK